jgi:SAM-dependent methyltransferase/uncharacterized protein YbaR (Trm112 family)
VPRPTDIADLLHCPGCAAATLLRAQAAWRCTACGASYPELDGVPVLFADPAFVIGEWRLRLQRLLAELRHEAALQREALARTTGVATRNRLKIKATGLEDQARRLGALLAPLGVDGPAPALETHRALGTPLPDAQGLAAYYVNAHRDWCWGAQENEASLAAVTTALGTWRPERVLVLGSGAGRLAYDLHQRMGQRATVALDINPLFAILARRICAGASVELYEFPVAPRDAESQAILRTLAAETPARAGLAVVMGDATRAPFAPGRFDLVVTPWLIDVIDLDFAAFARQVNALLGDGGRWVNTGSLAFADADPARQYGLDEVTAIVGASGFTAPVVAEQRVPYLCSPASRHGRMETVVTFAAVRESAVTAAPPAAQPDWLAQLDVPVPALPAYQSSALAMRIYGYVASLIDGRRSISEIARVLVDERLMTAEGAPAAVQGFLRRLHDDARRRDRF